jgi:hypothetical protein
MSEHEGARAGDDPLIDEVRAIRQAISEQYGNDVDQLCDHLQELERQHNEWTVAPSSEGTSKKSDPR